MPPLSRYERARRQDLDANRTLLGQDVVFIGDEWRFRRCSQRCEFSIVPIGDHDKSVGIDATGKLTLWPEQIRDRRPFETRNRRKIVSVSRRVGLFQTS